MSDISVSIICIAFLKIGTLKKCLHGDKINLSVAVVRQMPYIGYYSLLLLDLFKMKIEYKAQIKS